MNKVIHVPAFFEPVGKNKTIKVPTGEKKKGFFGGEKDVTKSETVWEQTGWSDSKIDSERLAADLSNAIESLNIKGYEVVTVTSIISGNYKWQYKETGSRLDGHCAGGGGFGYGYGYSYTDSLIIVAKKNA
jgi:hypothetical protein